MNSTVSYRTEFESCYVQDEELHAHRYRIEVTVDGPQRYVDFGQIIDYKLLGKYVREVCPAGNFLIGSDSTVEECAVADALKACGISISYRSHKLTIESLCESLADELQDILHRHEPGVRVIEVKLRETNDSFATWSI